MNPKVSLIATIFPRRILSVTGKNPFFFGAVCRTDSACDSLLFSVESSSLSDRAKLIDRSLIPVVFHILKNYYAHHICKSFNKSIAVKYDEEGRETFESASIIAFEFRKVRVV